MNSIEYFELSKIAKECGFDATAQINISSLQFMPEVRAMCAPGKCPNYDKSWCCPPAVPSLSALSARCRTYDLGILVQTIGEREDSFDMESIDETRSRLHEAFVKMADILQKRYDDVWPMGVDHFGLGACKQCADSCTWPDAPCRHPESIHPSMSACGLLVSKVCADNNLPYYYGPNGISFTACFFIKHKK